MFIIFKNDIILIKRCASQFLLLCILGIAIKCKSGRCVNQNDIDGNVEVRCPPNLESFTDLECDEDSVCYKEHQEPYGEFESNKYFQFSD